MPDSVSGHEDHAGYWLRFVSNHVSHAFKLKVEEQGVTVAEWVVMREMFNSKEANPSQLADKLGLTRGTVSKLIERLCAKQLALRSTSEGDRRFQTVGLTPAGRKLLPGLARLADENDREFFGHLTSEEKATLVEQLREIVRRNTWKDTPVL
ncbi:MAG: MarR family transcriptional regulator [Planctomyces sp.]|nr:MarR family transcriptional regulator [Planctomyces sp.]